MLSSKMKINQKLLPMKGHYFLFNAGTAPLVPYMSTYARQLGFSSGTVGLIYTVLPLCGLVAKPLFGAIADRFKLQKTLFILFQIVTAVTFLAIYFIPEEGNNISVKLGCIGNKSVVRSCYDNKDLIDTCKVARLLNDTTYTSCNISCNMNSSEAWQVFCDKWSIPQYCNTSSYSITFSSHINDVLKVGEQCLSLIPDNIIVDDVLYHPNCHVISSLIGNNDCKFKCGNNNSSLVERNNIISISCPQNILQYSFCSEQAAGDYDQISYCEMTCNGYIPHLCEGKSSRSCKLKALSENLPDDILINGLIPHYTTKVQKECVSLDLTQTQLSDGTALTTRCTTELENNNDEYPSCHISCDNLEINEMFQAASDSIESTKQYTRQFWLFFLLMIINWVGQAVVVSIADAICFNLLGNKPSGYGRQRLWGSVGWGIFSLLTGTLIDVFSEGANKDYTVAFALMLVFMSLDVVASAFIKNNPTSRSHSILADVGSLLSSLHIFIFLLWTIAVGLCTGLVWQFLFWHLEDISKLSCDGSTYIKTLQGIVSAIQSFCGEIPFMFLSGAILKRLSHIHMMTMVLFAFGVRFLLYSFLTNAWWALPIEMLQGVTFGMFYPTMTSYASVIAPPGTETTVQGLIGAVFEGIGTSLGSFIGGRLYETYGGWNTFRWFGCGAFVCCILHCAVQFFVSKRKGSAKNTSTEEKDITTAM